MNLQKLNDITYLQQLSQDKEGLTKEIVESKGYVLHVMEKNKIIPPLDYLVEEINPYALLFIIKNYELTRGQIKEIRTFFNSTVENKVTKEKLTPQEIQEYIQEELPLPRNTLLDLETIRNFPKELVNILQKNQSDTRHVLENSVADLSMKEFLSLDETFLSRNLYLFNRLPQYFSSRIYKEKYKELILDKNKRNNNRDSLSQFYNYQFEEQDKNFLFDLLESTKDKYSQLSYSEQSRAKGFTSLISKMEYFRSYNPNDVSDFTIIELEKNKKEIEKIIIDNQEKKRYDSFSGLFNMKSSVDVFKSIVDEAFFSNFVKDLEKIKLRYNDGDNQESKDKYAYIQKTFLNWFIKNSSDEAIMNKVDIEDMAKIINEVIESNTYRDEQFMENAKDFYLKIVPQYFTTEKFTRMTSYFSSFLSVRTIEAIAQIAEENPSINFLTVLLKERYSTNKYRSNKHDSDLIEIINKMIPELDKKSVIDLTSYYNHPLPLLTSFKKKEKDNYDKNFLNYKGQDLNNLHNVTLLFDIKEDFREYILKSKTKLPDDFISRLINQMDDNKNYFSFMENYLKIHEKDIKNNESLIQKIVKNPVGKSLIKLDNEAHVENQYKLFITKSKELNELKKQEEKANPKTDHYNYFSEEKLSPELRKIREEIKAVSERINDLKENFTFDFLEKKIKKLIKEKNFKEYSALSVHSLIGSHNTHLIKYINKSNFNDTLKNLESEEFRSLIKSNIDYSGKTEISFNKLNSMESSIVAELLLPLFDGKSKPNVFKFFPENKRQFANEFVIKHMPLDMFYSYQLCPPTDKRSKEILSRNYSNKELLEGFKNVEKTTGFFADTDVNARYYNTLRSNFKDNNKQFKELLGITKETNYKFYAILSSHNIFEDALDYGYNSKSNKTKDQVIAEYFKENFDLDTILKGMKIILDQVKNQDTTEENKFNNKEALSVVQSFIHNTYYDIEENGKRIYLSPFNTQESEKIVNFLFNEAPYFLMSLHTIGNITHISKHIMECSDKYIKDDSIIDAIITPDDKTCSQYFSFAHDETKQKAVDFINGLISSYTQMNKSEQIDYISYKMEVYDFLNEQLDYDIRSKMNNYSPVLEVASQNEDLKNTLNITQRHFSLDSLLAEKSENKVKIKRNKI